MREHPGQVPLVLSCFLGTGGAGVGVEVGGVIENLSMCVCEGVRECVCGFFCDTEGESTAAI